MKNVVHPIYRILVVALFGVHQLAFAVSSPILIDINILGEIPQFEPNQLELDVGQEYLLVIYNDKSYSLTLNYEKFGQNVFTQFISGTPNVSQDGLVIPSGNKLMWHFVPQMAGEFKIQASNTAFNQPGRAGKIIIKSLSSPQERMNNDTAEEERNEQAPSEDKLSHNQDESNHDNKQQSTKDKKAPTLAQTKSRARPSLKGGRRD